MLQARSSGRANSLNAATCVFSQLIETPHGYPDCGRRWLSVGLACCSTCTVRIATGCSAHEKNGMPPKHAGAGITALDFGSRETECGMSGKLAAHHGLRKLLRNDSKSKPRRSRVVDQTEVVLERTCGAGRGMTEQGWEAVPWREIRADMLERGQISEEGVAAARAEHDAYVAGYRLAEERIGMKDVLAELEAIAGSQRESIELLREIDARLGGTNAQTHSIESTLGDTTERLRSMDETVAEIKDLVIRVFYE